MNPAPSSPHPSEKFHPVDLVCVQLLDFYFSGELNCCGGNMKRLMVPKFGLGTATVCGQCSSKSSQGLAPPLVTQFL